MVLGLSAEELIARQKEAQKRWRLEHPEQVKVYQERHRESKRQWAIQNRERINAKSRENRAKKTGTIMDFAQELSQFDFKTT